MHLVPPNQGLPPSHPFAIPIQAPTPRRIAPSSSPSSSRTQLTSESVSVRSVSAPLSVVISGVPEREVRRTPPPPRRSVSVSRREGPPIPPRAASRLPPSQLRDVRNDDHARRGSQGQGGAFGNVDINRIDPEDAMNARMISLSLDRPLPPLPADGERARSDDTPRPSRSNSPVQPVSPQSHARPRGREASTVSAQTFGIPVSMDRFEAPNASPGVRDGATPRAFSPRARRTSVAMGGRDSRARSGRSKIFRWDSNEKVKKPDIAPKSDEEEEFSVDRLPPKRNLWEAGTCFLKDEEGNLVCFGDFFPKWDGQSPSSAASPEDIWRSRLMTESSTTEKAASKAAAPTPHQAQPQAAETGPTQVLKTVLFFIRHFWCGQCQDYTFASLSLLDPVALAKAGLRVVIISNGSWKIIKSYRKLFNCPFPIYVDGPRRLYQLMGMTKMTNDFGPMFKGRAAYHQRPVPTQLLHGLGNAFFKMPLANPGTLTQLGGEFILTPGLNCEFAHRMTTTSDHMEAPDVLRRAGCEHPTRTEVAEIDLEDLQKAELERLEEEMRQWREGRVNELDRIRQKKAARRGVPYVPSRQGSESNMGLGLGSELGPRELPLSSPEHERIGRSDPVEELKDDQLDVGELDTRSQQVLWDEETRAKEILAAGGLMVARGKGDLPVEVEI